MVGWNRQHFVLLTSQLLLIIYQCQSHCNYEILSHQGCYSVRRFVRENIDRNDYRLIFESSRNDSKLLLECREACHAATDEEFLRYASKRGFQPKTDVCGQLQEDYNKLNIRQAKQLSSLRRVRGVHQKCREEKSKLTKEVDRLLLAVDNIQYGYQVALAKLNIRSLRVSVLEKEQGECERRILRLSQAPADEDPPEIRAQAEEIKELKRQMTESVEHVNNQKAMVESLKLENELLKATNAELREEMSEKLGKSEKKHTSCREEVRLLQRKVEQRNTPVVSGDSPRNASTNCPARFASDFCSFEVTDLAHKEACWFERVKPLDYNWRVVSNLKKGILDHTCSSARGRFMFIDLSKLPRVQPARLTSVLLQAATKQCFSFWYNVGYTFNYGQFYIKVLTKKRADGRYEGGLHIWQQNLGRKDEWQFAKFEIPSHVALKGYRIQLTATSNGPGYVALDDLGLTKGPCPR